MLAGKFATVVYDSIGHPKWFGSKCRWRPGYLPRPQTKAGRPSGKGLWCRRISFSYWGFSYKCSFELQYSQADSFPIKDYRQFGFHFGASTIKALFAFCFPQIILTQSKRFRETLNKAKFSNDEPQRQFCALTWQH